MVSVDVRRGDGNNWYLFKFVQICLAFEVPHSGNVLWELERFGGLPVFYETTFIRRDDTVISVTILGASIVNTHSSGSDNPLTVMRCTGNRCSLSRVSRGLPSPLPSYSRMVPVPRSDL